MPHRAIRMDGDKLPETMKAHCLRAIIFASFSYRMLRRNSCLILFTKISFNFSNCARQQGYLPIFQIS